MKTQRHACIDADRHYDEEYIWQTDWKISKEIDKFHNIFIEKAMKALRDCNSSLSSRDINYEIIKIEQFNRDFSKLIKIYQQDFYKISKPFETWASRRRILLNKLHTHSTTLERTKEFCEKGKFTFSSISVIGSVVSILLDSWRVDWAHKAFLFSSAIGILSLTCSLVERYQKKQCVEDILHLFSVEKEEFEELERNIKRNAGKNDLRIFFPYGVDVEVLNDSKVLKSNAGAVFKDETEMIFFAILVSNVKKDINLLKDEDFISKVQNFSHSKVAKIWWNRLNYKSSPYNPEKSKLYKEMKSSLLLNLDTFSVLPLAALPMYSRDYLPALGLLILHSKMAFDAFCEISVKFASKESTIFNRLKLILKEEYEELKKVYNDINPYKE